MADLQISFLAFLSAVVVHIVFVRISAKFKVKNFASIIVFAAGLFFPMSISSIFLYLIFSGIYLIYFVNAYVGEGSPSAEIYFLIKRNKATTFDTIRKRLSNSDLISKRLENLCDSGLVRKKQDYYYANFKGRIIVFWFNLYRKLLNLQENNNG